MKKDSCPGAWDSSASGHLDTGETYDAAAIRELFEEIGLRALQSLEALFKLTACVETGFEFAWVYRCRSDGPLILNSDEIEKGGWFHPEQVTQWMRDRPEEFAPTLVLLWPKLAGF